MRATPTVVLLIGVLATGRQVTLLNTASDELTLAANGCIAFWMPVAQESPYGLTRVNNPVLAVLAGVTWRLGSADGTGVEASFRFPSGVAVDSAGNVYVGDAGNSTIRKVTAAGVVTTLAGTAGQRGSADGTGAAARFDSPSGVAVDGGGNVYVADDSNHTIRKITTAGVVTTLAGTAGERGSADGTGAEARFSTPSAVAVDGVGNVFVAEQRNNTIRKITAAGVVTTLAGAAGQRGSADGPGAEARFDFPSGIAVDGDGNVYVTDNSNHTIRKITAAGMVLTLAGAPRQSGSSDGTGAAARFHWPVGVAVDNGGTVYVADWGNHTIRKITPAGVVTTVVGSAGVRRFEPGDPTGGIGYPAGVAMRGTTLYFSTSNAIAVVTNLR